MSVSTNLSPWFKLVSYSILSLTLFGCMAKLHHVAALEPQARNDTKALVTEEPTPPTLLSAKRVRTKLGPPTTTPRVETHMPSPLQVEAQQQELNTKVQLGTRLFVSKDGLLHADFSVYNDNAIPVRHLVIQCEEFSSNRELLRSVQKVLSKGEWIAPKKRQFFSQIQVGKIDDAFETVSCALQSFQVPAELASL